ncbi:protein kinase domain protein [Ichthyophthirius multifiliis]|uniref:Cyclin-dependent kinase 2 homolog n=1 Tax=Ichthyophthirius multifiliis TaxID=5932 RepID=G0QUT0_ICHMU|nr:protein kinase domain protein [Ichthyophthirius multifiliis]EGR31028.1 protein kinase domain protein [Ichthyophthirius multifiliis]|eukprot:XP_004034514.1 protein kinase domain protein [Ichthyophthirius multifiliis]
MKQENQQGAYEILELLGEGTYGKVFKAQNLQTKQFVAIKKIKMKDDQQRNQGIPSTALREISCLKALDHSNIIKIVEIQYQVEKPKLYIILEYMENDLSKEIKHLKHSARRYPKNTIKSYMHQILRSVDYCHRQRVFHRDIKPQNILISQKGELKLADFGLARFYEIPITTVTLEVQTLNYRAPELLLKDNLYSLPIDIWSIGCIFYELITGEILFTGYYEIDILIKIFQLLGTPDSFQIAGKYKLNWLSKFPRFPSNKKFFIEKICEFDVMAADLLFRMIEADPVKRISANQAINHQFFQGIDFYQNSNIKQ